jgi:hypothetical protein
MNTTENNKYRMYLTTERTLEENQAIWTGISALEQAKTHLNSNIASIKGYSSSRENDPSGLTLVKRQSREQLEKALQKMIGGIQPHLCRFGWTNHPRSACRKYGCFYRDAGGEQCWKQR